MKRLSIYFMTAMLCIALTTNAANAQTTEFSFQGSLKDNAVAANGNYDFEFALFDLLSAGSQIGATIPKNNVVVTNGIFSVKLDFGSVFPGADRYLEIRVRLTGQPGITTLGPRQLVNSAPYSVKSLNTDNASQLGGVAANQYVLTTDPRLSDPRDPLPGSASYIQNRTSTQSTSNFNISGTGQANIFDAATQYNMGGFRVFSAPGTGLSNTFAGYRSGNLSLSGTQNTAVGFLSGESLTVGSGNSLFGMGTGPFLTTGGSNTFVGTQAGYSTTTGGSNTFVGPSAGYFNVTGTDNAYFGISAGRNTTAYSNSFFGASAGENTTSGFKNTFIGENAGAGNTTGSLNIAIGRAAGFTANNLNYATVIGSEAQATSSNSITLGRSLDAVMIPGSLNVTGAISGNGSGLTNFSASNFTSGVLPVARGGTGIGSAGSDGNFLRSDGTNWASSPITVGDLPAGSPSYVQINPADFQPGGFLLAGSGFVQGTLGASSYYMQQSEVLSGNRADGNLYVGDRALPSCFPGPCTGVQQTHVGIFAGQGDNGVGNTFIGYSSGHTQNPAFSHISAFGFMARSGLTSGNATAIGARAFAECGDCVILGSVAGKNGAISTASVGIGITEPMARLHVGGNVRITGVLSVEALGTFGVTTLCRSQAPSNSIADCSSSLRYKDNVTQFQSGMDLVTRLSPITFNWKQGGMKDLGLAAEDVEKIDPRFVTYNDKGEVEGVKYDRLSVAFVNAFKEQQAQIEAQAKEINEQKTAAKKLQTEIDLLKAHICSQTPAAAICKPQN